MKDLTHGFDVAVQISRHGITRCLESFYGLVPPRSGEEHVAFGDGKALAQVWFGLPDVTAAPESGLPAAVTARFPFTARLSALDVEETGYVYVVVSAVIDEVIQGADVVTRVVLRVGDVAEDAFTVVADGHLPTAVFTDVVAPFVVRALRVDSQDVPLTPKIEGFLDFRMYGPGEFGSSWRPDPTPIPDFVGLFVNRDGTERAAPEAFAPALYGTLARRDELVVMIPRETVLASFDEQRAALGLGTLPARMPGADQVTLNSVELRLGDGTLRLTGSATLHDPVLPDPTVNFTVVTRPSLSDGTLALDVVSSEVDLPWWADALEYLVPVVGTILLDLVKDSARGLLTSAVGGFAGATAAGLGPFTGDLPDGHGFVAAALDGRVRAQPDGLLVYGSLDVADPVIGTAGSPPYIVGNVDTYEFHRPGCDYLPSPANSVRFVRESAALQAGYDGCRFCARELDEDRLALLRLRLDVPATARTFPVRVHGTRAGTAPGPGGVREFHVDTELAVDVEPDGSRTVTVSRGRIGVLEPGQWSVSVSSGTWSAQRTVSLPPGSAVLLTGGPRHAGLTESS